MDKQQLVYNYCGALEKAYKSLLHYPIICDPTPYYESFVVFSPDYVNCLEALEEAKTILGKLIDLEDDSND